jgi:hypothetical protein
MNGDSKGRSKLASRAVYGSFLALATAFVLSSTVQLVVSVFELGHREDRPKLSAACKEAIDGAFARAEAAAADERSTLQRACSAGPRDGEALAALFRLWEAQEAFVRREKAEIEPLRQAVRSQLFEP